MVLRKTIYYPFAWGICLNSSAWEQCVKGDYVQNRYAFMGSVPDAMQTQGSSCGENIPFSPLTCFSGSMGCFYSHRNAQIPVGRGQWAACTLEGACHAFLSAWSRTETEVSTHTPLDWPGDGCRKGPFQGVKHLSISSAVGAPGRGNEAKGQLQLIVGARQWHKGVTSHWVHPRTRENTECP